MKYVDYNGSYRCYLSDNGLERRYLGCRHDKPRQAHKHSSGTYAPPSRSAARPVIGQRDNHERLTEAADTLTSPRSQVSPRL